MWYHKFSRNGGYGNAEERPERRVRGLAERVIPLGIALCFLRVMAYLPFLLNPQCDKPREFEGRALISR